MSEKTILARILDWEFPADIVYKDEHCLASSDIKPQTPTHVLLIPKREIPSLDDLTPEDHKLAGHLMMCSGKLALTATHDPIARPRKYGGHYGSVRACM